MPNKTFLVRLRSNAIREVRAATVEKGKLAGLFLLDLVESWNEIPS
jgi:hypothetical protein